MKLNRIPTWAVRMKVICADTSGMLSRLNAHGIPLLDVRKLDELTVSFCIPQDRTKGAIELIERLGGNVSHKQLATGNLMFRSILQRPVLIMGLFIVLILTFYLPSRILFVNVIGNERISEQKIIAAASDCGIHFGAVRHEVRSEKVKNRLLAKIPDLKWVGINTKGCVAEISVRERAPSESNADTPMVSSLVASRDGVIRELTVKHGNPICRVGQAVKKGELLVSGYTDCGRCIYGTRADAEIYAQTWRALNVTTVTNALQRTEEGPTNKKIGLLIGKKRINFYKGSGISDVTCVRMYYEYPLTLPGGFQLPIALTVQKQISCAVAPVQSTLERKEPILQQYAHSYLESQMIGGKVGHGDYQIAETPGVLRLTGQYICDEMIGQTRSEEIINQYEQTD